MPSSAPLYCTRPVDHVWDLPCHHQRFGKQLGELTRCAVFRACVVESREMVDAAWEKMDAILPDSFYKCVLRAFSWYLLRRHY